MEIGNILIAFSGILGALLAAGHGYLLQRFIVRPLAVGHFEPAPGIEFRSRFVGPLIHFTTVAWLLGGLTLVFASTLPHGGEQTAICVLVGASYVYGAGANLVTSRGRHPGGWLMVLIILLLVVGSVI